MTDFEPQAISLEAGRGHEPDTLRVGGIVGFAVGLVVVILAVLVVPALLLRDFAQKEQQAKALAPAHFVDLSPAFPAPCLQAMPSAEWLKLKREADQRLKSYGWIDRRAGFAHIPIDRALEIIAKSGIPPSELPNPAAPRPAARAESPKPQAGSSPNAKPESKREEKP